MRGGLASLGMTPAAGLRAPRVYSPHVRRHRARASSGLSGGVSDLPALRVSQHLLARAPVHPVAGPGERVPGPVGAARRRGVVRRVVGGARLAARALRAADRCAAGNDRAPPQHLQRAHRGGGVARLPAAAAGGGDQSRVPHRSLPVAGQVRTGRGRRGREPGRQSACRSRRSSARWTGRPRWSRRATSSSPAARSRTSARSRRSPIAAARCCWWTAIRPRASSRWTSSPRTWTSTAPAGSSGCSAGAGWRSSTPGPTCSASLAPRATGWFAHREQFRFDSRSLALHADARRLEAGTPAMLPVYAQLGGLDMRRGAWPGRDPPADDAAGGGSDRPGAVGRAQDQGRRAARTSAPRSSCWRATIRRVTSAASRRPRSSPTRDRDTSASPPTSTTWPTITAPPSSA